MGFELRKKGRYEGAEKFAKKMEEVQREAKAVWGVETKDFTGTLSYVKITTSDVNCIFKNLRGDKSRSGKGIKKGMELCSFIS